MINLSRILILLAGAAGYLSRETVNDELVAGVLTAAAVLLSALAKPGALLPARWTAALAAVLKKKTESPPAQ
jgi:hypothetical protein